MVCVYSASDNHPSPHFSAPTTDADRISWLQLIRSRRVGPATFRRLLKEYHTAKAALAALPEIARAAGVKDYQPFPRLMAEREFSECCAKGYHLLCLHGSDYPTELAQISDPPPVLWVRGEISLLTKPKIAMVGARNASSLGTRMTRLLTKELAGLGYVIVSGMARGIDAAAHKAALETGTIAVLASGLDVIYPTENTELSGQISQQGVLLSEHPPDLAPQARHFPQRNRIISGLAQGVIVVEGAARSGSLITARLALEQGREVMAVPGNPLDGRAAGCNILIRDGATLVRSGKDVAEVLAGVSQREPAKALQNPLPFQTSCESTDKKKILDLLSLNGTAEDVIIRESGLPAHMVSQHILDLELSGKISRQPGGLLVLTA